MNNAPRNIRAALRQDIIIPLLEVSVGLRSPDQLDQLATRTARRQVRAGSIRAHTATVLSVRAQRMPGMPAIEVCATVNVDGRYRAVALRVEAHDGRPVVTAAELQLS